ncbi:unnamed protein product [Soboliphyme baturini]|uniref:Uncharacterized protein n=1 Tax=Soboliphyme baturini TaxID=241478 RepID=A0A183INI6_9BILA|nr:unnamed protein product [Soboliphyme baturini]
MGARDSTRVNNVNTVVRCAQSVSHIRTTLLPRGPGGFIRRKASSDAVRPSFSSHFTFNPGACSPTRCYNAVSCHSSPRFNLGPCSSGDPLPKCGAAMISKAAANVESTPSKVASPCNFVWISNALPANRLQPT